MDDDMSPKVTCTQCWGDGSPCTAPVTHQDADGRMLCTYHAPAGSRPLASPKVNPDGPGGTCGRLTSMGKRCNRPAGHQNACVWVWWRETDTAPKSEAPPLGDGRLTDEELNRWIASLGKEPDLNVTTRPDSTAVVRVALTELRTRRNEALPAAIEEIDRLSERERQAAEVITAALRDLDDLYDGEFVTTSQITSAAKLRGWLAASEDGQ